MIKNLAIGGRSNKLLLVSALILGLLSAVLIGVYLSGLESTGGSGSSATVPVVVATQDIPAATTVTAEMVAVKAIPPDLALLGTFTETSAAVGQTTQVAILTGEQLVPNKVSSAGTAIVQYGPTPPLSVIVPDGKRGFSIALSAVASAGGLVRPGDYVDVLLTSAGADLDQSGAITVSTCYVLQNIQVLAIGITLTQTTSETDANGIAAVAPDDAATTMTLAVSPSEAGLLAAAQGGFKSLGEVNIPLWVALRKFSDHAPAADVPSCN